MDGAIVLDRDATRILHAAVHLMPDPSIHSEETGTRHRTADRVARQTGFPVISVSQSMQIIARLRRRASATSSRTPAQILSRANQALATLERYKLRLDEVSSTLSALEIEDLVTVRDVAVVAQRLEMVTRIAREIEDYVLELGTDGRLLSLQLDELVTGVDLERELVIRDYLPDQPQEAHAPRTCSPTSRRSAPTDLVDVGRGRPGAGPRRQRAPRRRGHPARLPAAGQGAAAARHRRRPAGRALRQPAEAARRPASTTCRPSRASASCGPAASARGCPGWPSPASSSATSERPVRRLQSRAGLLSSAARRRRGLGVAAVGRRGGGDRSRGTGDFELELHVDRVGAEGRRDHVVVARLGPRRGPGAVAVRALAVPGHRRP